MFRFNADAGWSTTHRHGFQVRWSEILRNEIYFQYRKRLLAFWKNEIASLTFLDGAQRLQLLHPTELGP